MSKSKISLAGRGIGSVGGFVVGVMVGGIVGGFIAAKSNAPPFSFPYVNGSVGFVAIVAIFGGILGFIDGTATNIIVSVTGCAIAGAIAAVMICVISHGMHRGTTNELIRRTFGYVIFSVIFGSIVCRIFGAIDRAVGGE